MELNFQHLPDLPQRTTIIEAADYIWYNSRVMAIWIGGSLGRGGGDAFSDVDFRVAVPPEAIEAWTTPDFTRIFARSPVVGKQLMKFGDEAMLHHLVLANGEIFDFFVQSITHPPTVEPRLILACRHAEFEQILAHDNRVPTAMEPQEVNKKRVESLLVNFWISTHKHRKVLHRGLDPLVTLGVNIERNILLRLWYIHVSGKDCGEQHQQTIHSMTRIVHTIVEGVGPQALAVLGAPMRNREELYHTLEGNRQLVSQLGRQLAQRYDFTYPAALETIVLQNWQEFIQAGEES